MKNKLRLFFSLCIVTVIVSLISCEDIYHPVFVKYIYEPSKEEDGSIIIKSNECISASFIMETQNNPDCVGFKLLVMEETEDNAFALSPGENYEVLKGNIVRMGLGTYVDAVPFDEGMEFSIRINNLEPGIHNLTFCVYASFMGTSGLGTFSSDYPEMDRLVVVVE